MSGIIGSKINIRGSGKIAKLGTDGQVLTSAGAGLSAAFEDLAGGHFLASHRNRVNYDCCCWRRVLG